MGADAEGPEGPSGREAVHLQAREPHLGRHPADREAAGVREEAPDQPEGLPGKKGGTMSGSRLWAVLLLVTFAAACRSSSQLQESYAKLNAYGSADQEA